MVNRTYEKYNQQIVYKLGLTSKCIYFDDNKGIKINEFIPGSSLDIISEFNYEKIAKLLLNLHKSNELAKEDYHPFVRFDEYENEAKSFVKSFNIQYQELRNLLSDNRDYLESQKLVLSHNDAQRSNIVKDNNDNYYLIDFEFMANNDEIYDIATFGNGNVEEGYQLLNHYFIHPTIDQKKRYYLWRIFISLQWYNVTLIKHYRGEGKTHNLNFLDVANHFLNNALTAYQGYKNL